MVDTLHFDWNKLKLPELEIFIKPTISKYNKKLVLILDEENSNLKSFVNDIVDILNKIWNNDDKLNLNYENIRVTFFNWEIDIDWKKIDYNMFYIKKSIYINNYSFINFINLSVDSLWVILWLAHEIWHHISRINKKWFSVFEEEQFSDFIAWLTLKKLIEFWYLDNNINTSKYIEIFWKIWEHCERNFIETLIPLVHWNGKYRKEAFKRGLYFN